MFRTTRVASRTECGPWSPAAVAAQAAARGTRVRAASLSFGPNVQMNDDSNPPLPQNETAVAVSLDNPKVAVAAANDYVSGGNVVMRTLTAARPGHRPG